MLCFTNLPDEIKQDSDTPDAHSKHIIDLLKNQHIIPYEIITIWENTDSYSEHYICATELFLLSMLSQAYNIIIDNGVSELLHVREVVDRLK